jgi:hypothetical protein
MRTACFSRGGWDGKEVYVPEDWRINETFVRLRAAGIPSLERGGPVLAATA